MKLPHIKCSIEDKLSEFDLWITPSLGDIRDTKQFSTVMTNIRDGMDILSLITDTFSNIEKCSAHGISQRLIYEIAKIQAQEAVLFLSNVINVLFLVTGKTDNNTKCQFPLYLSQQIGINKFPTVRRNTLTLYPEEQQKILELYLKAILSDEEYSKQLWSIGHSFIEPPLTSVRGGSKINSNGND